MGGFVDQLTITDILGGIGGYIFEKNSNCPPGQSELVIRTSNDWNQFRSSCFFSFYTLPDVDFSSNMVLVSTQAFAQFGTSIKALLEFNDHLTAVIEDDVSSTPVPEPGYPFDIVSVPISDLPVDFIRVEIDITSSIIN